MKRFCPPIQFLLALTIFHVAARAAPVAEINFVNMPVISSAPGATMLEAFDSSQGSLGIGHALADISLGVLKAELTAALPSATTGGSYSLRVAITDIFTLGGTSTLPISPHPILTVTGTGLAPFLDSDTDAPGGQSFGDVRAFVGSAGFEIFSFSTSPVPLCCTVAPGISFPISLTAVDSFTPILGEPFQLRYGIIIQGANGTNLDVMHTAKLSFDLPRGTFITSQGGFFQQAEAVPEPSTMGLVGLTVFGLFVYVRLTKLHRGSPTA